MVYYAARWIDVESVDAGVFWIQLARQRDGCRQRSKTATQPATNLRARGAACRMTFVCI